MGRISPVILLVIVILAIGFFILGLLQLLIRCLFKRPSFSSISQSNRLTDASGSHTFQRQLQQLFRLHDSGLDQALIDALPVFYYKDIYIVADANLQVALSRQNGVSMKAKAQYTKEQFANNTDMDTKKINPRSRGDSFSVSKIWLWSKKGKFPSSSDTNENIAPPVPKGSNLV
ncbi:UNVERIFIED_CONTAM: RING-H2 finger protein ATL46 [Sesamum calycinum]|uniref:RING-H2 finger protein ATL46 n=1 Tax=Sesamum calycinum TaxID=2727403 RepID=A0AAW2NGX1_9LAMI